MSIYVYVKSSAQLQVTNPRDEGSLDDQGQPMPLVSQGDVLKMLFRSNKFVQELGQFEAYDLRKSLTTADGWVKLTDAEFETLKSICTKPDVYNPVWFTASDIVEFLRGIVGSTNKPPAEYGKDASAS